MSYGKNTPIADNATRRRRNKNRRIEILVYKETALIHSTVLREVGRNRGAAPENPLQLLRLSYLFAVVSS